MRYIALAAAWLGLCSLLASCRHQGPATSAPQTSSQPAVDHSREVARYVDQADEIVSVLANGLTVIAKRVNSPAVAVRGYVRAGSIHEGQWLGGGLSHLLEHLVAGGTNARRSEARNRDLLQEIGNDSNAYTYLDHTCYYVNTTPPHLDKAVDLVTGWMLTAGITTQEFERERQVVQRELEKDKGEPDWAFAELVQRNRYRQSPAGVPIIGYQAVIQKLTRDDLGAYYRKAYQPNNMVLVVVGDLPAQHMLDTVRKHVADAPPGRAFEQPLSAEPSVLAPRTLISTFPRLGQAKLDLGFPSIELAHPDLYALDLLAAILGQGEASLLVQELRDRLSLVDSVRVASDTPAFVQGTFRITMELDAPKRTAATEAVLAQLDRVKREGVDAARIQRAKAQVRAARAFGQQTSEDIASALATDLLSTGDPHFSDQYTRRLQAVTVDDLKRVAGKYLDVQRMLTTALLSEDGSTTQPTTQGAGPLAQAAEAWIQATPTTAAAARDRDGVTVLMHLKDGTPVLLKRLGSSPVVSMQCWALGGLSIEDQQTNGLGNLAMRLVARGAQKYSARQIAEFFDAIGGSFSAACGNNTFSWQAGCLKDDWPEALAMFAELLHKPSFPAEELEPMQKRVLAALDGQDADWLAASMRYFRQQYFGPLNSPYQFIALGSQANVRGFTIQQVRDWYTKRILAAPRVIVIFGDINTQQATAALERHFGPVRPQTPQSPQIQTSTTTAAAIEVPTVEIQRVEVNATANPQAGVVIGFASDSVVGSPQRYALTLADTLVSGYSYPTGYIFETLRGRGLVYDANAFDMPGRSAQTPGCFVVYAGCEAAQVNEVVEVIVQNIARLQAGPADINMDWFERAKRMAITANAMENQTAAAQAQAAALDELLGLGYRDHEAFGQRLGAVTLSQLRQVAKARLSRCVITISTPQPQSVKIVSGKRTYRQFPPVDLTPSGVRHDSK
jgi:zinc protease